MDCTSSIRLAVFQGSSVACDLAENKRQVQTAAMKAAAGGCDLCVFPELFICGYDIGIDNLKDLAISKDGPLMTSISEIAHELHIAICVPYSEIADGLYYNSAALFSSTGELILNYRKCHLFSEYEESVFTKGEELLVATLPGFDIKVGILICFDIEFPEPARVLRLQGAELLIVPTALGTGPVAELIPLCTIPTRALENHCCICYSNFRRTPRSSNDPLPYPQVEMCGRSAVVAPNGVGLQRASPEYEGLLVADFEPGAYTSDVERNPYLDIQVRRPSLYAPPSAPLLPSSRI
jgi:predicted amidohydrolase